MKPIQRVSTLLLVALLAGTGWATVVVAQPGQMQNGERMNTNVERGMNIALERLELTDAQDARVRALLSEHRDEALAWFDANEDATRAERMEFHAAHRASLQDDLDEILTDDQMETLRATLSAPVGRGMRSGRGVRSGDRDARLDRRVPSNRGVRSGERGMRSGRGDRMQRPTVGMAMTERLDLTDQQADRLQAFREAHRQQMLEWRAANPNATREERLAFRESHRASMEAGLAEILTPEQQEELQALRSERPGRRDADRLRRPGRRR